MHKNFEELRNDPPGTIYVTECLVGTPAVIRRGAASLCAYVGIPPNHPWATIDIMNIDLPVHGGITYKQAGAVKPGFYEHYIWLGWDYAHFGDAFFYTAELFRAGGQKWTVPDTFPDVIRAVEEIQTIYYKQYDEFY